MLISTLFLFPLHNPPSQQSICFSYEKPFSNNYRRSAHGVECARYNGEMRAALVPSHRFVVARVFHLYLHNLKIFPHLNMIKVIKRRLTLRLRLHSESSKIRKFFFCFYSLDTSWSYTMCSIDNMAINWSFAGRETSRRLVIISFSCCNIMCCTDSFHSLRCFSSTVCIWRVCEKSIGFGESVYRTILFDIDSSKANASSSICISFRPRPSDRRRAVKVAIFKRNSISYC